jgi:thimet oligopeptidase
LVQETPLHPPTIALLNAADDVKRESEGAFARAQALLDRILAVPGPRTVQNTFVPFDELSVLLDEVASQGKILFSAHAEKAVREAGNTAFEEAMKFSTRLALNRPLYEAFSAIDDAGEDAETRYALFKIRRDFRRAGVDKDEATRVRLQALWDEITAIGSEFERNIAEDTRSSRARLEELEGLPPDWVQAHAPDAEGLVTITTAYPDTLPVLQYGKREELRKRVLFEFNSRAHPANLAVLDRLLARRAEVARLLGYATWADYITEDKMIGSAQAAADFIDRVTAVADRRAREDREAFLERKRRDVPSATTIAAWDRSYYRDQVKAERHQIDPVAVRSYLPFARVREGLLAITAKLFGVRYERVDAPTWHPSVEAYDILDEHGRFGRFYLDLHPRPGKFTHAAAFPVTVGRLGLGLPQIALLCNFPDPAEGPGLMMPGDVRTFFHEFGHLLHYLFAARVRWSKNSPFGVEWDFVEAPSQMLEEWCRDPELLRSFAKHHESGEPMPLDLAERLERSDAVGRGLETRRQMFLAAYSLALYRRPPEGLDTTAVARELIARYDLVPYFEGTHFQCSFGHLDGYSAIYYTYEWSLVLATDLFGAFRAKGPILNPAEASRYRQAVLAPGGSKPAADLVRDFLGREPGFEAFEEWLNRPA